MGFVVADGAADVLWIRAILDSLESLKGRPDNGIGHWSPDEWRDLEHLHQQHQHQHQHQQQQQQEQQLRLQQYQQRQKKNRYRQQRQQQQHQYHLQQQYETSRRWQHQQYYKRRTARPTSEAQRVEARADREEAQAEKGGAPPTSQTTSKLQSLCEYPVVLFASQPVCREPSSIDDELLDSMENGLLGKPAQKEQEEILEKSVQEPEKPQQSMHAAQPRPCLPVEEAGKDEMGVLGEDQVVAGGGAGVEEQRPAFWDDGKISVWWPTPKETELDVDDGKVIVGNGGLVVEDGEHAPPPLLQQQQEPQAAPPQEPWPPPMAAEQKGGGAGSCVESGLWRLDFSSGTGADDESFLGRDDDLGSYTTDGCTWERAGIGTGRSCSRTYMGSGCEVAGRRLTRQRRARVREK